MFPWTQNTRVDRYAHNHIFQGEHENCHACGYVDAWHRTVEFVQFNRYQTTGV